MSGYSARNARTMQLLSFGQLFVENSITYVNNTAASVIREPYAGAVRSIRK